MRKFLVLFVGVWLWSFIPSEAQSLYPKNIKWRGIYTDSIQVFFPEGYDTLAYRAYQRAVSVWQLMPSRPPKGIYSMRINPFSAAYGFEIDPVSGEITWMAGPKVDPHTGPVVLAMPADLDKAWFAAFINIQKYDYYRKVRTRLKKSELHPEWFSEGYGALLTTTLNPGNQGGYLSTFMNPIRSMAYYRDLPKFSRVQNRSIRFNLPSNAQIGYLIHVQGAILGGRKFSDSVITYRWRNLNKLSLHKLMKDSGLGDPEMIYRNAKEQYATFWGKQLSEKYMEKPIIARFRYNSEFDFRDKGQEKGYLSFEYPSFTSKDEVVVLKKSMEGPPAIYAIRANGRQVKLTDVNMAEVPYFSCRNDAIVWSEIIKDPVYDGLSYSQVRFFHLRERKSYYIAKRTKWYHPDVDEKGKFVVCIDFNDTTGEQALIIVQVNNGVEISRFPNKGGYMYYYPKFTQDNNTVVVSVSNAKGEMSLMAYDVASGRDQSLLPFTQHIIGVPSPGGMHIFFESSYGGVENIYNYRTTDKEVFQVTGRDIGSYQPYISPSEYKMTFTDYTPKGKQLLVIGETDPSQWINVNMRKIVGTGLYAEKEVKNMTLGKIIKRPKTWPESKKADTVSSFRRKFLAFDFQYELLNAAYRWESSLKTKWAMAGVQWRPNDPVLSIYGEMGWRLGLPQLKIRVEENLFRYAGWYDTLSNFMMESRAFGQLMFPWQWNRKGNIARLNISASAGVNMLIGVKELSAGIKEGAIPFAETQFRWVRNKQKAPGDYLPLRGQVLRGRYIIAPGLNTSTYAAQISMVGMGLNRRHRWQINAGYEQVMNSGLPFRPYLNPIRGQLLTMSSQALIAASAEYHFVLLHVDQQLLNAVQFRRLRANLFADMAIWEKQKQNTIQAGIELSFDLKWFNRHEFPLGLRSGLQIDGPQKGKILYQVFLPLYIWN